MKKIINICAGIFFIFGIGFAQAQDSQPQIDNKQAFEIIGKGSVADLKSLLQKGFDVNTVYQCNTPLIIAIKGAIAGLEKQLYPPVAVEKVKILVDAGADVNFVPCPGERMSPLSWAVILPDMMKDLGNRINASLNKMIQAGVGQCNVLLFSKPCKDISPAEQENINKMIDEAYIELGKLWTPDFMKIIGYLVDNGADVNGSNLNRDRIMQLHLAASNSQDITLEPLQYLINKGADVNIQDSVGATPLFWAFGAKNEKAVNMLKAAGANENIRSKNGKSYNEVMRISRELVPMDDL